MEFSPISRFALFKKLAHPGSWPWCHRARQDSSYPSVWQDIPGYRPGEPSNPLRDSPINSGDTMLVMLLCESVLNSWELRKI